MTNRRVLVVEDNSLNRTVLRRMISMVPGWDVIETVDGLQGLEQARAIKPDLVLLDLQLPGMMGDEVLAHLKGDPQTASIPVVMVSAQILLAEDAVRAADYYLVKPIDVPRMQQILADVRDHGRILHSA